MKQLKMSLAVILFLVGLTSNVMAQTGTAAQYMQAGNASYTAKNYDMAIQYYQAAVNLNPNYGPAYQGLGNSYYFKGDNPTALKNYEKALSFDPNNASLNSFVQSLRAKVGATAPAPAAAASTRSPLDAPSSASKFELGLNAGLALSSITGFGGGASGFLMLDKNFGIGAMANYYTFGQSAAGYGATASASTNFIEILAGVKYKFDGTSMRPYLFGGVGMANATVSATVSYGGTSQSASASEMDPMIQIGGGVEFPMGPEMNIFAQGKYSDVLVTGGSSTYEPIEGGINFSL